MGVNGAMLGLQIGKSVLDYTAGNSQANAATQAQWNNYVAQKNQQQTESNQVTQDAATQMSNRAVAAAEDMARIQNTAATGGVAGLSVDHLLNDAQFQQNMDNQGIEQNSQNKQMQIAQEGMGRAAQTASNINNINSKRPTMLGTGLQIATDVAQYKQSQKNSSAY